MGEGWRVGRLHNPGISPHKEITPYKQSLVGGYYFPLVEYDIAKLIIIFGLAYLKNFAYLCNAQHGKIKSE